MEKLMLILFFVAFPIFALCYGKYVMYKVNKMIR